MNKRDFKKFLECSCGGHILGIVYDASFDNEVSLQWISCGHSYISPLWERLKMAWELLREGRYCTDDILLTKEKVDILVDILQTASNCMATANTDLDKQEMFDKMIAIQDIEDRYELLRVEKALITSRE